MFVHLTLRIQIIVSFYYRSWLFMYAFKNFHVYHTAALLCNIGGFKYKKSDIPKCISLIIKLRPYLLI